MEQPAPPLTETPVGVTDLVTLTALLIRHHGIHEGRYKLAIGFRIGVGNVGNLTDRLPGAVVGVESVSLVQMNDQELAPDVVDAAIVNSKSIKSKPSKPRRKPAP